MAIHFDEAEAEKQIDALMAEFSKRAGTPGHVGTQARMQLAVLKNFNIACLREINRNEDLNWLYQAAVSLMAAMVLTLVSSHCDTPEERADVSRNMLHGVAEQLECMINGGGGAIIGARLTADKVGTA